MVSLTMATMYLLVLNFALFGFVTTAVSIPGTRNPICDFFPGYCQTGQIGLASGTLNGIVDSSTVTHQQQQAQSCGIGGLIGGAIGAIGFIAGPVGIGTTAGGFLLGCAVSASFFPAQGAAIFNQAVNGLGPLGDVLKALVFALQYVGPLISFVADSVTFEIALFTSAPEIGVWMFPLQGVAMIMIAYEVMRYFRGVSLF